MPTGYGGPPAVRAPEDLPADLTINGATPIFGPLLANAVLTSLTADCWMAIQFDDSKEKAMAATASPFAGDFTAVAAQLRELNDKLFTAAKQAGSLSLDSYERTVAGLLDVGQKAADSIRVDQISEIARFQAAVVTTVTRAYTQTARALLK